MKKFKTSFQKLGLSVGLCIAASTVGHIQAEESGFTLTPMVGARAFDTKSDLDSTGTATLAAGYKFASPIALELAYMMAEPGSDNGGDADVSQLRLDGLFYVDEGEYIKPFFLAGIGQETIDYNGADSDALFVNLGFGLKAAINDKLSFRGDVRSIVLDRDDEDRRDLDAALNLGVQWLFGASKPSTPAKKAELDSDNDGVLDKMDNCPSSPAGTKVDATGCAMKLDDDNDGVFNAEDKCPDTKAGAKVDELGCYVVISEDVTVNLHVKFANNSEEMVSGADDIAKVADFMKQYPLTNVVIEGHTDSVGRESYNLSLSQRRANAVAVSLTNDFGVDARRISAVGLGEGRPIETNDTAEGRAANRRVTAVVKASVEKIAE